MIRFKRIVGDALVAIVLPGGIIVVLVKNREGVFTFMRKLISSKDKESKLPLMTNVNHFSTAPWHRMRRSRRATLAKKMQKEEIPQWAMCS